MPQSDFTVLFSVTLSLFICLNLYYSFFSLTLLPDVVTLLKFRIKLIDSSSNKSLKSVSLPNVYLYRKLVSTK